jgi:hypothetical protein
MIDVVVCGLHSDPQYGTFEFENQPCPEKLVNTYDCSVFCLKTQVLSFLLTVSGERDCARLGRLSIMSIDKS